MKTNCSANAQSESNQFLSSESVYDSDQDGIGGQRLKDTLLGDSFEEMIEVWGKSFINPSLMKNLQLWIDKHPQKKSGLENLWKLVWHAREYRPDYAGSNALSLLNELRESLTNAEFTNLYAPNVILRRADLTGACFKKASLCGAQLSGSILHGVDFTEADLTNVVWTEDAHFKGASAAPGVRRAAFSQSGSPVLAVAQKNGKNNKITVYGAKGEMTYDISKAVHSISVLPGGEIAYTSGKTIYLCDRNSHEGRIYYKFDKSGAGANFKKIGNILCDPKGNYLAITTPKKMGFLFLLQLPPEGRIWDKEEHPGSAICLSDDLQSRDLPSGNRICTVQSEAASSKESQISVNKDTVGKEHGRACQVDVSWHPSGKKLASVDTDHTVRIWDVLTGECTAVLKKQGVEAQKPVRSQKDVRSQKHVISWHPNQERLASSSPDCSIVIWDLEDRALEIALRGHTGGITNVFWYTGGERLISVAMDRTIWVWDIDNQHCVAKLDHYCTSITKVIYHTQYKCLAMLKQDKFLSFYELPDRLFHKEANHSTRITNAFWLPNEEHLATSSLDMLKIWKIDDWSCESTYEEHTVSWTLDGECRASIAMDKQVTLLPWPKDVSEDPLTLNPENSVNSIVWAPCSKTLAIGCKNGSIEIWDTSTGKCLLILHGHKGSVTAMDWAPDEEWLASASEDKTVRLWGAPLSQACFVLKGHDNVVQSVSWNKQGNLLATAGEDKKIFLWQNAMWERVNEFIGHTAGVTSLSWHRVHDKILASASKDKTVRLWSLVTSQCIQVLRYHLNAVNTVVFSQKDLLVSGGDDYAAAVWKARAPDEEKSQWDLLWCTSFHSNAINTVFTEAKGLTPSNLPFLNQKVPIETTGRPNAGRRNKHQDQGLTPSSLVDVLLSSEWTEDMVALWGKTNIADNRKLIEGLAKKLTNPSRKKEAVSRLWDLVELARKKQPVYAGSNALTLLNYLNQSLTDIDFTGIYAPGADLSHCCLMGSNFSGADLSGACFSYSMLDRSNFREAQLENARWGFVSFLKMDRDVQALAFAPNGARIALGFANGRLCLTDCQAKKIRQSRTLEFEKGHKGKVNAISWSVNGEYLASAGVDALVLLWDPSSGVRRECFDNHTAAVTSLAWHPTKNLLASGSSDSTVYIWDFDSSSPKTQRLTAHTGGVTSLSWHPGGIYLAIASKDGPVHLWSPLEGKEEIDLLKSEGAFKSISWHPKGYSLAGVNKRREIRLMMLDEHFQPAGPKRWLVKHKYSNVVTHVSWRSNDQWLASVHQYKCVRSCNLNGRRKDISKDVSIVDFNDETGTSNCSSWSPDGRFFALGGEQGVNIWEAPFLQSQHFFHTKSVSSLTWHPSGDQLASSSKWDKTIRIWDANNGENVQTIDLSGENALVNAISWDLKGKYLARAGSDKRVSLWGDAKGSYTVFFADSESEILSMSWDPKGDYLATVSQDNKVRLWNLSTARCEKTLSEHSAAVTSVHWHPTGDYLASASKDTILIWQPSTGECKTTIKHDEPVRAVCWQLNGKRLATASGNKKVSVWKIDLAETDSAACTASWKLEKKHVGDRRNNTISWYPDGDILAIGGADNKTYIWNCNQKRPFQTLVYHNGPIYAVAFNKQGWLATGGDDNAIAVWKPSIEGEKLSWHLAWASHTYPSAKKMILDGAKGLSVTDSWLLSKLGAEGAAFGVPTPQNDEQRDHDNAISADVRWEVPRLPVPALASREPVHCMAYGPKERLALGLGNGDVYVWEHTEGGRYKQLAGSKSPLKEVTALSWHSALPFLASGSADNLIRIWNTKTWNFDGLLKGHRESVRCLAWHPRGKWLASGSTDKTVRLWTFMKKVEMKLLHEGSGAITSISWQPNGKWLAIGSESKSLRVLAVPVGNCVRSIEWPEPIHKVSWHPKGKYLVVADSSHSISIWRVNTLRKGGKIINHSHLIEDLAWHSTGFWLASASKDGKVKVWSQKEQKCIADFPCYTDADSVSCVGWHPDEPILIIECHEGALRAWSIPIRTKSDIEVAKQMLIKHDAEKPKACTQLTNSDQEWDKSYFTSGRGFLSSEHQAQMQTKKTGNTTSGSQKATPPMAEPALSSALGCVVEKERLVNRGDAATLQQPDVALPLVEEHIRGYVNKTQLSLGANDDFLNEAGETARAPLEASRGEGVLGQYEALARTPKAKHDQYIQRLEDTIALFLEKAEKSSEEKSKAEELVKAALLSEEPLAKTYHVTAQQLKRFFLDSLGLPLEEPDDKIHARPSYNPSLFAGEADGVIALEAKARHQMEQGHECVIAKNYREAIICYKQGLTFVQAILRSSCTPKLGELNEQLWGALAEVKQIAEAGRPTIQGSP